MRNTIKASILIILTFSMIAPLGTAIPVAADGETVIHHGPWLEREYLPSIILYDPPGDGSFQYLKETTVVSFKAIFESEIQGYYFKGSLGYELTTSYSYQTPATNNPDDMGPGIGDRIIGKTYLITWDVDEIIDAQGVHTWNLTYLSSDDEGIFALSRTELRDTLGCDTVVEDKTGQGGPYNDRYDIGKDTYVVHSIGYEWSGSVEFGVSFKVTPFGWFVAKCKFGGEFSGTVTYDVEAHYYDSSKRMIFYETADLATKDVGNHLGQVQSYVLWYGFPEQAPPTITSPPDMNLEQGTTMGQKITWNAEDRHTSWYLIKETYQSQTSAVDQGPWMYNGSISYVFGDLAVGTHRFTCQVLDLECNNNSDSVDVTVFAHTEVPIIDDPPDLRMFVGAAGQNITWHPRDRLPSAYEIWKDNILKESKPWNGSDIRWDLSIENLAVGTYTYKCTITDVGSNTASSEVKVTVGTNTIPTIDTPLNVVYQNGTTGHSITWHPVDSFDPSNYTITRNGVVVQTSNWDGGNISISVDGLSCGTYVTNYQYVCTVRDLLGNTATSGTTKVTVKLELVNPLIDSPPDAHYVADYDPVWVTWHASDAHPGTYRITSDSIKGDVSGVWSNGTSISIDVGGLGWWTTGRYIRLHYHFTCTVWDACGNSVSDTVDVWVLCAPEYG